MLVVKEGRLTVLLHFPKILQVKNSKTFENIYVEAAKMLENF